MTEQERQVSTDDVVTRNGELMTAEMGDELAMLDPDAGRYFGMNSLGRVIWERLAEPTAVHELCDELVDRYDVDAETCRREVLDFLDRLVRRKLVTVHGPDGT